MAVTSVSEWSTTAGSNTELDGISLAENVMRPPAVNNAFREMMSQIAEYTRRGSDLATAATLDLDSVDTMFLDLTGTVTVTAVTLTATHSRRARAAAAFQLTASASLVVNGSTSTNYTTTAGDLLFFEGYSGGVVRVWAVGSIPVSPTIVTPTLTLKQSASPSPTAEGDIQWDTDDNAIVVGDGASQKVFRPNVWEHISTTTISSAADWKATGLSAYRSLRITGYVKPATDGVSLILRTSTNNGAAYDAGASDYTYHRHYGTGTTPASDGSTGATSFNLGMTGSVGSDTDEGVHFTLFAYNFNQALFARFLATSFAVTAAGTPIVGTTGGFRAGSTARDAIAIFFSSGNIASGTVTLEGMRG